MTRLDETYFTERVVYSSDVSPEHCHGLIAYKDDKGDINALYTAFCESSHEWLFCTHELYTERENWVKDIEFSNPCQYTQDVLLHYGPQSSYIECLTDDELTRRLLMFEVVAKY